MEQSANDNSKMNFENLACGNQMEEEEENAYKQTHEDITVFIFI